VKGNQVTVQGFDLAGSLWGQPYYISRYAPGMAIVRWTEDDGRERWYYVTVADVEAFKLEDAIATGEGRPDR
jgi:hypothetical protein